MAVNVHEHDQSLPVSLRGKRDEVRKQHCDKCPNTWYQMCGNARKAYTTFDNQSLCANCKRAYKKLRSDLITVTCDSCAREYQVTPQGHYAALKRRGGHTCKICVNVGKTLSEEHKKKLSDANKGKVMSDEAKAKISVASKARFTSEHHAIMNSRSSRGKGRTQSPEERAKRSACQKGLRRSDEHRANIGKGRKAYLESIGGVSRETRAKLSDTVSQMRMNGFRPETRHKQEHYTPIKPQFTLHGVVSPKKIPYFLSSSWESLYARWLDMNPDVVAWTYEAVRIPYADSFYIPDFIWLGVDGRVHVIEIKPKRMMELNFARAQDKIVACREWCAGRGWIVEVVTEVELGLE